MEAFNDSFPYDQRMWKVDLEGSIAYVGALERCKLLSLDEGERLKQGLKTVETEWDKGSFVTKQGDEDVHTAHERRLGELIGPVAGKLHTGRSRNDQVATDLRMWLRDRVDVIARETRDLITTASDRAEAEVEHLMPGYTHLQRAQPLRWSHWLLSHAWAFSRDLKRLHNVRETINECPLGSGALAGHAFGIDRHELAKALNFAHPMPNSIDATSSRDFVLEFLSYASIAGIHLSRMAEDLIIWSSAEYGFVRHSDAYSTGSSLMPQKRNPDALELLRGKSGRSLGSFVRLATVMKGLPQAYNKDLQEDKECLFDAVDTIEKCLAIARGVVSTMEPNFDRMKAALSADMLATDLADYLVRKGVPFRETHHVAGAAVGLAEKSGKSLSDLTVQQLQSLHPKFESDVLRVWDYNSSVENRSSYGGTSRQAVLDQISLIRRTVAKQ